MMMLEEKTILGSLLQLVFTAILRLLNTPTKKQKVSLAEAVVSQLGLTKYKNNIVGSQTLRGVSGGERKRVSIGQEMLINPSLLFLDEPTSGLDSTTAQRIVSTLWDLVESGGRTVKGTLCILGKTPRYGLFLYYWLFSYCSYEPFRFLANGLSMNDGEEESSMVKEKLVLSFKDSDMENKLKLELEEGSSSGSNNEEHLVENGGLEDKGVFGRWSTTWWQQFMCFPGEESRKGSTNLFLNSRLDKL